MRDAPDTTPADPPGTADTGPPRIFLPAEGDPELSSWQLGRRAHCEIPTRGVRSDRPLESVPQQASAFSRVMPAECAFSHGTAADLLSIPVPRRIQQRPELDVMRPTGSPPLERQGVRAHSGLEHRTVIEHDGLPLTSPADTWCDLAAPWLGLTVDELIIAGDAVCELIAVTKFQDEQHPRLHPGDEGWEQDSALRGILRMMETLKKRRRHKGKARLLEAFPHLRPRVWSPMETRLRLILLRAGLPEPLLNAEVHFAHGGGRIMTGDLVWREQRVIGEFHGLDHRSLKTRAADSSKRGLAEADGWRVVEVFKHQIFEDRHRSELIRRFAAHLDIPTHEVNFWA